MGDTWNGKAVNSRQMMGARSSTKIYAPPGGHSNVFLGEAPAVEKKLSIATTTKISESLASPPAEKIVEKNDYADQLKAQIDMKRKMDEEAENKYNGVYNTSSSRAKPVPLRSVITEPIDVKQAPPAGGRRGQVAPGGATTFSLGW